MDPIKVRSCVLVGTSSVPVTIEAIDRPGDSSKLRIVGLPETAERGTRVRIASALMHNHIDARGVVVAIVPEQTHGSDCLDLPIALAVAAVKGKGIPQDVLAFGELSLEGTIRPVRGAFVHARALSGMRILAPAGNADAVSLAGKHGWFAESLGQVLDRGATPIGPNPNLHGVASDDDIADVPQASIRRALEIAAAGRHNLLLIGRPGSGKVMAARRLVSILPALDRADAAEVAEIHDAAGLRYPFLPEVYRPFRAPHHTVSEAGLVAGGIPPRPGEVCLAHSGVLLLDELPEFRRNVLGALAHELRNGAVIRRAHEVSMPARPVVVVGTANPCPCGYGGHCKCSDDQRLRWNERLAGCPIRFDLIARIGEPSSRGSESSATVRARVQAAWDRSGAHDRMADTIAHLAGYESPKPEHEAEANQLMWVL